MTHQNSDLHTALYANVIDTPQKSNVPGHYKFCTLFSGAFRMQFALPLLLALVAPACVSPGQDFMRRQSLFGSPTTAEKTEPAPASLFGTRPQSQNRNRQNMAGSADAAVAARPGMGNSFSNSSDASAPRFDRYELTKVEGNVWRTSLNAAQVYSMLSRIVSQSYMVSQADRRNLNIQTDWDKFFIDGRLFRNRISVSVFPVGSRQTEVVLKNTLEYFSGQAGKADDLNAQAWLPSPDITDELPRIIDSLNRQTAQLNSSNRSSR